MILAPAIGHRNWPGSTGSARTPVLRFGPWAASTGITSTEPGVSCGPRRPLKPSNMVSSTPYLVARLAGVSPILTTTTTPGTGGSLIGRPTLSGMRRPGFDQTTSLQERLNCRPMVSRVSPCTTTYTIGARLMSGDSRDCTSVEGRKEVSVHHRVAGNGPRRSENHGMDDVALDA